MKTTTWLLMLVSLGFMGVIVFWLLFTSGFWTPKPAPTPGNYIIESED